ncbi:MAG: helix-turn-helix transcriptional regulator [Pseudomonadota bacterium]
MAKKKKSTKKLAKSKADEELNQEAPEKRKVIGSRLKMLREEQKLKQPELAAKLGWGQSKVSKIERGMLKLDLVEFLKMMDAMRCSKNDARFVLYGKRRAKKKGSVSSEQLPSDGLPESKLSR